MADDMEGLDFTVLNRYLPDVANTAAGRAFAESKPMSYADGRSMRTTGRTAQMNLKVRHAFREQVFALARQERLMMVEIIEKAVAEYIERRGR